MSDEIKEILDLYYILQVGKIINNEDINLKVVINMPCGKKKKGSKRGR